MQPLDGRSHKRNAAESQRRILDAAEVEFAAKGFDGARLGSIARAAEAQAALIHHYFDDKEGLYRAVIARALDALSAEGWEILKKMNASMPPPPAGSTKSAAPAPVDIPRLVEAFIDSLLRFYATHTRILAILHHEARSGGDLAADVVKRTTKPVFEAIVTLLDRLRREGAIRADVDPSHLCISGVAMAAWPFQEHQFVSMVFPIDVHDPRFTEARQREIVTTLLERMLPR